MIDVFSELLLRTIKLIVIMLYESSFLTMGLNFFFTHNQITTSSTHAHDHVAGEGKKSVNVYGFPVFTLSIHTVLLNDIYLSLHLLMHRFNLP